MAKRSTRTLVTPVTDLAENDGGLVATDDKREWWVHILPTTPIGYTDKDSGEHRTLEFSEGYNAELIQSYNDGAMTQVPFMLADKDNSHTMDPERQRGEIVALRQAVEGEAPGLWGKVRFATKKAAQLVRNNPRLPVSARIRENWTRDADGKTFSKMLVHVLGTLDEKVPGLSGWKPAVDLSEYASGVVIDLSGQTYSEASVAKNGKDKAKADATVEIPDLDSLPDDPDEIAEIIKGWTDEQFAAFVEAHPDLAELAGSDDVGDDEGDDDVEDPDEIDDNETVHEDDKSREVREPQEAALSNDAKRQIDLANTRADEAMRLARQSDARWAAANWARERDSLLRAGVAPSDLDLAQPVLSGGAEFTIDLSNSGGAKSVNVSKIVRGLLDSLKGTIDLSEVEIGREGYPDGGGQDEHADLRAQFDEVTSDL